MRTDYQFSLNRFISLIGRSSQLYFDRELSPINIRSGQIRILKALDLKDGVNQEYIRLLFDLDKATIAKTIKPLVREGYIDRTRDPGDKRSYIISLTDKGREIMPMLEQTIRAWADILTAGFTRDEKRLVNDLLARTAANARHHLFKRGSPRKGGASE